MMGKTKLKRKGKWSKNPKDKETNKSMGNKDKETNKPMGKKDNKTKKSLVNKEHTMTGDDDNPGSTQQNLTYVNRKH